MPRTLRARLALWHLGMLAVTLGLFATLLYAVLANNLRHHHDDELREQAQAVTEHLRGRPISDAIVIEALAATRVSSRFVMIRDDSGELHFREPALHSTEPNIGRHTVLTHVAMTRPSSPEFFTADLEQSGAVRFICVPIDARNLFLQIGDPIGDVQAALDVLRNASLTLLPLVLVVSAVGSWVFARRALRPVRAIAATVSDISASDLSRRVQVSAHDRELATLVASLNELLDRLQRAFERLQQFAGDVSHQVQTPLTVMKSAIEAAGRDEPVSTDRLLAELGDQVDAISATVAELHALAVADTPVPSAAVNLSTAVDDGAEVIAALADAKDVKLTRTIEQGIWVSGDVMRLKQVVLNLGENAVKYTPAGGDVEIRLCQDQNVAVLEVKDNGVGIDPGDQQRIFDRLFRGNATGPGIGLGLAIAKRMVDAHRGSIDVVSRVGQGAKFTVRLPLAGAPRH